MLFDSDDNFPDSVVKFTRFASFELRQMFAYLRHKEHLLQEDIKRLGEDQWAKIKVVELKVIEAVLIWMSTNITGSACERAKRKWGR